MAKNGAERQAFNIVIVGQDGRLGYEAVLFAASLAASDPGFTGRLFIAEPQPGRKWAEDPRIQDPDIRALLTELGAEWLPFDSRHFGQNYPYGNKIEALLALPENEPFVFFDTDTLVTGPLSQVPFDFDRPTASLRREGTWPVIELYGPSYSQIWTALYEKFGLDITPTLDPDEPEDFWKRYMYFNAGWFFYRCPHRFGRLFLDYARAVQTDPPDELLCQPLDPWLDQAVLPLVIHALGGARQTLPEGLLDGSVTCHYRMLPLLYARESDAVVATLEKVAGANRIKRILKGHDPIRKMVYHGKGAQVRALFDQNNLPRREQMIRNRIKKEKLWMR